MERQCGEESAGQCWLSGAEALIGRGCRAGEARRAGGTTSSVSMCWDGAAVATQGLLGPLHPSLPAALAGASLSAVAMATLARGVAKGRLGSDASQA